MMSSLAACTQSPTGRSQVLLFSENDMQRLGEESFSQLKEQETISADQRLNRYVQCVTNQLVAEVPGGGQWEVVLFDSKQVNAFALPGGKVGVYTGLFKVANTQDQLAAVIGHEIAHVLSRHSNERVSRTQLTNIGLSAADAALGQSGIRQPAMAALGLGVQVGYLLPYGREQEAEADRLGLQLMAKAGFDPEQAITLWRNMAAQSNGQPPQLLSTHPSHGTRIQGLSSLMSEASNFYRQARGQGKQPACGR
ncbi:M48 family metallopeptidase [Oceanimonas sp. CHS3-5]|uniref:M48 family metallopeptidase n=1 Tax=Oceanimonas sp. CHS3-5 TaxID=3068186 RepID=UPI00273DEE50|nr:M48 family metallopeptidase [Oceanimonas sp. CHS3-5]MDP5291488.1 M48 family metallopeptidase [Oceanimonas sp. CHS3-5]